MVDNFIDKKIKNKCIDKAFNKKLKRFDSLEHQFQH